MCILLIYPLTLYVNRQLMMSLVMSWLSASLFQWEKHCTCTVGSHQLICASAGIPTNQFQCFTDCTWTTEIGQQGSRWMCRWVGMTLLCICKVFPCGRGKQMIMMSLEWHHESSVYVEGRGYIRRTCTSLKAIIWVSGEITPDHNENDWEAGQR